MRLLTLVSRRVVLVALAAAVVFPAIVTADSGPEKLDPLLRAKARQWSGRSRVIVEFRDTPDATVITREGGVAHRRLARMRAQVADVDNHALETLASEPEVARVIPDRDAFATVERTGAASGAALARWQFGLTGQGVGVAVIDSGVAAEHDDLYLSNPMNPQVSPRVVHFRDFTREVPPSVWLSELPTDDFGHGTHVTGIIAGNGFDTYGTRTGVAPRAKIVSLKVLDANGHGYVSDVIDAIDYAIAIRDTYNIRVINLSVATGVFESFTTDPLAIAAKRAVDAGIVVVAAAGNMGEKDNTGGGGGGRQFGGITCPGNAPWVLTVGAANHVGTTPRSDDRHATFSSLGPTWIDFAAKPDLLSYGVGIESLAAPNSTLYARDPQFLLDGTRPTTFKPYLSLSGTSMAAPVVAGTIALMLEANPALTPNAVKALLQYTAQVQENEHYLAQGAGLLNARGAVRMARFFADPMHRSPQEADIIAGEWNEWARKIVWGNVRVGGGMPLPGSNAWELGVTWGSATTPAAAPVTWGVNYDDNNVWSTVADNIVWSTSADNIVWSTADDNIVWSTADGDNIVWSTAHMENVVWGGDCGGVNCRRTLWGARADDGTIWGTANSRDNIVWSTNDDNIVWSTNEVGAENIVWSTGENIVWSTNDDNIVWSTGDNIVWSTGDNIVWSTGDDNIVWSTINDVASSTSNDTVANTGDTRVLMPLEPDPAPTPDPEPTPAPAPAPAPTPDPEPTPEPAPTPTPDPRPTPAPAPAPTLNPEPMPAPAPTPDPRPTPEPAPAPTPDPEPAPKQSPAPTPDPEPTPDESPAPDAGEPPPAASDNIVWSTGKPGPGSSNNQSGAGSDAPVPPAVEGAP